MICKTYVCDKCGESIVSENAPQGWRMIHAQIPDEAIDLDAAKTLLCRQCYGFLVTYGKDGSK